MSAPRIPRSINNFNSYIANTNSYLLAGTPTTNAERLGILPTEVNQWTAFATSWKPLFVKYSDQKNSRTTAVKDQLHAMIAGTIDFDKKNHILDRIAASPSVTIEDMEAFNIKKGILQKSTRTRPNHPITEPVHPAIQPLGGGSVLIRCHDNSHKRASIHDEADCVQYNYMVDDIAPASAEATGLIRNISSKASFTLNLGADKAERHLYIYFRWYNIRHPELTGPWSPLFTTLIL